MTLDVHDMFILTPFFPSAINHYEQ